MSKQLEYGVIHTAATPQGREVSAQDIREWHTSPKPQGRGWKQVGYSDIIHFNGKVTNLVPYNDNDIVEPWEITNGVRGINSRARHVVLPGGLDADGNYKDTRTAAQRLALANYIRQSIVQHPNIKWGGHYQFDAKKPFCPGWNVPEWLRTLGVPEKNIYNP
ncbi:MAG: lysozyme [Fulvivirga sp.]